MFRWQFQELLFSINGLRITLKIVWIFDIFDNNLEMKTKYWKEICW